MLIRYKIEKEDWPAALAALYNNSKPLGMGMLHFEPEEMTKEEADKQFELHTDLKGVAYFDYLKGRVMKVEFSEERGCWAGLYDRDNGVGAFVAALESHSVPFEKQVTEN